MSDGKSLGKALMGYGRDVAQGASNAIASNVSAPVDGIAWLLRKAGVPVPSNPMGGSDWMAEKGLTQQPQNHTAGLVGEFAGMAGPMVAAAKAPQIAKGLLQMGENAMVPRTMNPQAGAVVWHGSPHKFDAFDSSKIGTGEGAQAYGHGLYLADNQGVAGSYKTAGISEPMHVSTARDALADPIYGATLQEKILSLKNMGQGQASDYLNKNAAKLQSTNGSLYKVDLPDEHIAKMLDWDKPLSGQHPDVQAAADSLAGERMRQLLDSQKSYGITNKYDTLTGEEFLRGLGKGGAAESALKAQGIPGIRYLDGGSRATGGTSNYVVFPGNESMLNILERNGQSVK